MAKAPVNLAASVKDRLLRLARKERQPFDVLLVRFALERLLYRLSLSPLRDQFILKGGLLVTLWLEDDNRVTRDADFLAFGNASAERLIADFGAIMKIEAADGLTFDIDALTARPIREGAEYGGMRLTTTAFSNERASPSQSTLALATPSRIRRRRLPSRRCWTFPIRRSAPIRRQASSQRNSRPWLRSGSPTVA